MNENLFASFITPTILGLPIVILIIIFQSILFPTCDQLVNNCLISLQQWLVQLTKTMNNENMNNEIIRIHNSKGQT